MTPFEVNSEKIWTCVAMIEPGSVVCVHYLSALDGKDAKGVGVPSYKKAYRRKYINYKGLCKWDVIN